MYSVYSMQKLSILQAAEKKSAYRKHRIENIEKAYMINLRCGLFLIKLVGKSALVMKPKMSPSRSISRN